MLLWARSWDWIIPDCSNWGPGWTVWMKEKAGWRMYVVLEWYLKFDIHTTVLEIASWLDLPPTPLPPFGHIWDVMLIWRKGNIKLQSCLCCSVVYSLKVDRLYQALILLGLPLYLPSASVSLVFMVLFLHSLRYYFYWTEPGAIGPWHGYNTIR